ncbi:MAG TPA: hypothetical protein VFC58_05010 [Desulfosporosinus sp.]|nr:hypothetical protein [Desulfosporosinus sp.]
MNENYDITIGLWVTIAVIVTLLASALVTWIVMVKETKKLK